MKTNIPLLSVLAMLITLLSFSCQSDEAGEVVPKTEDNHDYFPLTENSEWQYLQEFFMPTENSIEFFNPDTLCISIKGDTIMDGLTYKKLVDQNNALVKVVRKKENKYYARNQDLYVGFAKEYLFLDETAAVNTSWKHYKNDSTLLTEYKVTAINSTQTLNNKVYHNVMELEVNYFYLDGDAFVMNYSTVHYYEKGVGEIYANYPYAAPQLFSGLKSSLLKYNP